jgi:intracellular sulfur oxidation DsrE/DsrF family protein
VERYLLIESQDPFASGADPRLYALARMLKGAGAEVQLLLVQNAVLATRPGPRSKTLTELSDAGVQVLAERFALKERGISHDRLAAGVQPAELDIVIDEMTQGTKTLWH